jgi:polyhydroxyalkanoate synthase
MSDDTAAGAGFADLMGDLVRLTSEFAPRLVGEMLPAAASLPAGSEDAAHWAQVAAQLQAMWLEFQTEQALKAAAAPALPLGDPAQWLGVMESWYRQLPLAQPEAQQRLWDDTLTLWQGVLGQYGAGALVPGLSADHASPAKATPSALPRHDKRFADSLWQQPYFAVVHQSYLLMAEQITALADNLQGVDPEKKAQLRFATRTLVDALSPDHFPLTNPLVLDRALATRGDSLLSGMRHLLADLRRGQLTHTDPDAFRLGENIAVTPGKVIYESPLFQLIQYRPTTEKVLEVPLLIFPPWINRFYILDLNPRKSFVQWAVAQGVTVFMVSWKSADASMAEVVWDDYIRSQIEAIEVVRARLNVPAVHTMGYCVGGTTLAATLAVLSAVGQAEMVKSATFLATQVDFEQAGALKLFVNDQQIDTIGKLAPDGFLDGRYMAATFNLLRGNDLIWNYVIQNYLLGEDYTPFDLLHWNGDTTNLPAKWHQSYLRDLYRDNRLVVPGSLSAGGIPIDLHRIATPCYIQAGREDHIAPPESVWRMTRQLSGRWTFMLAGSGHIAGVVNPPAGGKYQYWTNPQPGDTLESFVAGAEEHPGSWWPHWAEWLRDHDQAEVKATGKRKPGGRGDTVIEDAPGRYVMTP